MAVYVKNNKAVIKDTRSKKAKKADNAARRTTWAIKPITKIKPSAKVYSRKNQSKPDW